MHLSVDWMTLPKRFQCLESGADVRSRGYAAPPGIRRTACVQSGQNQLQVILSESAKLSLTELMAEVDYRLVEGGGEQIQLDALTARIVSFSE